MRSRATSRRRPGALRPGPRHSDILEIFAYRAIAESSRTTIVVAATTKATARRHRETPLRRSMATSRAPFVQSGATARRSRRAQHSYSHGFFDPGTRHAFCKSPRRREMPLLLPRRNPLWRTTARAVVAAIAIALPIAPFAQCGKEGTEKGCLERGRRNL